MAMMKTLYSISALSVELGRDRRTIACALNSVPPDGKTAGGRNGGHLQTVLQALDGGIRRNGNGHNGNGQRQGTVATGRCPISPVVSTTGRKFTGANRR